MGLKLAAIASAALALGAAAPADYVASRQQPDGGFAEPGARSDPALSAWAVLGLKAAGRPPDRTATYLRDSPVADTTDLALRVMALRALGESPDPFLSRLQRQKRKDGRIGALAAGLIRNRWAFAALCFALGFAFGCAMDLWHWYSFWPHTWEALTVVYARGVWFSAAHAIGNVVFAVVIGPELRRLLERYGRRLRVEVAWA